MKVPKSHADQEASFCEGQKTLCVSSLGENFGSSARRIIRKKTLRLRTKVKDTLKAVKHDTFSTSDNSNFFPHECSTKMDQPGSSHSRLSPQASGQIVDEVVEVEGRNEEMMNAGSRSHEFFEIQFEIRQHMLSQENLYIPLPHRHTDGSFEANRSKMCTWIFEVCARFNFKLETGFLAVNILDRVLGLKNLSIKDLVLLGVTSLFMASKYEEIKVPEALDFSNLLYQQYGVTRDSILRLESSLLLLLDFNLSYPSPLIFISDHTLTMDLPPQVLERAEQIAKHMIINSTARYSRPSLLASHSIQTAIKELQSAAKN